MLSVKAFVAPSNNDPSAQLALALQKTGVFSLQNPCMVGGFYAASAAGAVGTGYISGSGEVSEGIATLQATQTAQVLGRSKYVAGLLGFGALMEGYAQSAYNYAKSKVSSGCDAMQ